MVTVVRIVPDIPVSDTARAAALYAGLFDLAVGMDSGWVGNLAPVDSPTVQLQLITTDAAAPCNPIVSVGVQTPADVDAVHARVVAAGLEVVHPLGDEAWGVRRFFFRDLDGNVINVVANA
jgi:catechol 2,3-dioxygenase-like lactoylglutathione lyase family enzyme